MVEVAAMLRVSKMTVYRMVDRGELQGVRIGKLTRVVTASVWAFLNENRIEPTLDRAPALTVVNEAS